MQKKREDIVSILTHISGIFLLILGPLIFLFSTKKQDVKVHAKKALNWQISLMLYFAIIFLVMSIFIIWPVLPVALFGTILLFSMVLFLFFAILNIFFSVFAAINASKQKTWKYPFSINFLKK